MNSGVPIVNPRRVFGLASVAVRNFEMPKSSTLAFSQSPSALVRKTLPDVRSRWITPRECAASSAEATCTASRSARGTAIGPDFAISSPSVEPSRYSSTRYGRLPGSSPKSVQATMLG